MSWREQRASARQTVHRTFEVPALVLSHTPVDSDTVETEITVRIHNKYRNLGNEQAALGADAVRMEDTPRAIFLRTDLTTAALTLTRNMVISVLAGEAYNIEVVETDDIETIAAQITRLDSEEAAGLPVPE